jgi:hypothetical protein
VGPLLAHHARASTARCSLLRARRARGASSIPK